MKIKTWLLLSYLCVMFLPLLIAYTLFAWIQTYHNDQKIREYVHTSEKLQKVKFILDDPRLYEAKIERPTVDALASKQLSIVLYSQDGFVVYSSNPVYSEQSFISKEQLYEGLYTLEQGFRIYSYKEPVFNEDELVGFYKVELLRSEWVNRISNRTYMAVAIFIGLFALIYSTVILFMNRKFTRRLSHLKKEMTAFAKGEKVREPEARNDEIGELEQHFYKMRKEIDEAKKAIVEEQRKKEYMVATISHDLKTPLTSIRAYTELLDLNQDLSTKVRQEYGQIIIEKAEFMEHMLNDLLTYTLLQSPTYEMELVKVEGAEFFEMLVSDYGPLCQEKHIQLEVYLQVTGSYAVNPEQMMRVADNLMSNAIQHTHVGNRLWIAGISDITPEWLFQFVKDQYEFDQAYGYFIVQNEGEGITQSHLNQLFEPLYQVDQSRSKKDARGTGLGLSITKQIIEKHGGDVQIFSKEQVGVSVICRLPKMRGER